MCNTVKPSPLLVLVSRLPSHMYYLTVFATHPLDIIYVLPVVLLYAMVAAQEVTELTSEDDKMCYPCRINGEAICITWSLRCDGENHCDGGSDELFEICYGDKCVGTLAGSRLCDGVKDCRDGRDEYFDGCRKEEEETSVRMFGNMSTAVAVSFLISVVIVLLGLVFCICCCCRRGRAGRPYISDTPSDANKKGTVNGYRWVSHAYPLSINYSLDGSVAYDASDDSVQFNTA